MYSFPSETVFICGIIPRWWLYRDYQDSSDNKSLRGGSPIGNIYLETLAGNFSEEAKRREKANTWCLAGSHMTQCDLLKGSHVTTGSLPSEWNSYYSLL